MTHYKTDPKSKRVPTKRNLSYARQVGDMRTLVPPMTAADRDAKFAYRMEQARKWCQTTHDFRMLFGRTLIGPVIQMTGSQARERNAKLEERFIKGYNSEDAKPVRLQRWVLANNNFTSKTLEAKDEYHYRVRQTRGAAKLTFGRFE